MELIQALKAAYEIAKTNSENHHKVVDIFFPNIDFGTHDVQSMRQSIGKRLASNVIVHMEAMNDPLTDRKAKERMMRFVEGRVYIAYGTCSCCGESVHYENDDGIIQRLSGGSYCFDVDKIYKYRFKSPSGKFLIANDLRNKMYTKDYFGQTSLAYYKGIEIMTEKYANDGVIVIQTGNTTAQVQQYKNGNFVVHKNERDNLKGNTISCSLWWVMGTDLSNIKEQIDDDHVILDLDCNSEYELQVDYAKEKYKIVKCFDKKL